MEIYFIIVAAVIILGLIMPQHEAPKKTYILIMAVLHSFVCGFRYKFLTGDLMTYNNGYVNIIYYSWTSDEVLHEGRNAGFYLLEKLFAEITNGDFQVFLIFIAIVTEVAVAVAVYYYSPIPWLSYLVWNCLGFYVFGFSAIKQALAMGVLVFAFVFIIKDKPVKFTILTLIAGFIHMPALVFLPAYWIAKLKINKATITAYIFVAGLMYIFKSPIVSFISSIYYEDDSFMEGAGGIGGRFIMIVAILVCAVLFKGFQDRNAAKLFNLIAIAAIFQMLSGFDNIFTRMTDYYFQFSILLIPMIFSDYTCNSPVTLSNQGAVFSMDELTRKIAIAVVTVVLILFYYYYNIGIFSGPAIDDYTNYRFMWDV